MFTSLSKSVSFSLFSFRWLFRFRQCHWMANAHILIVNLIHPFDGAVYFQIITSNEFAWCINQMWMRIRSWTEFQMSCHRINWKWIRWIVILTNFFHLFVCPFFRRRYWIVLVNLMVLVNFRNTSSSSTYFTGRTKRNWGCNRNDNIKKEANVCAMEEHSNGTLRVGHHLNARNISIRLFYNRKSIAHIHEAHFTLRY